MKVGIFSDLHMEFEPWLYDFKPGVLYINAGDTHNARWSTDHNNLLHRYIKEAGSNYFYINGNHDYYGGIGPKPGDGQATREFRNLKVTGCTFWSNLTHPNFESLYWRIADSKKISNWGYKEYTAASESDLDFVLNNPADIVVTHHSPSFLSCHPRFAGDPLNPCFHSNREWAVDALKPKLWIHGHTHDKISYCIGKTSVVCHPKGYPNENLGNPPYEPLYLEV